MSNALYDAFGTDHQLEKDGVWFTAITQPDGEKVRFLLARMGGANKRFEIAGEKAARPFRKAIRKDTITAENARGINMKSFVEGCLLDWENVPDREGNPLQFSKENAVDLFEELPDLYDDLVDMARSRELYVEEVTEEDLKN